MVFWIAFLLLCVATTVDKMSRILFISCSCYFSFVSNFSFFCMCCIFVALLVVYTAKRKRVRWEMKGREEAPCILCIFMLSFMFYMCTQWWWWCVGLTGDELLEEEERFTLSSQTLIKRRVSHRHSIYPIYINRGENWSLW